MAPREVDWVGTQKPETRPLAPWPQLKPGGGAAVVPVHLVLPAALLTLSPDLWGQVRDYTSWAASVLRGLQAEEGPWDPSSSPFALITHRQLRAELEAREELQQQATKLGQRALLTAGTHIKEVTSFPVPPAYSDLPQPAQPQAPVPH